VNILRFFLGARGFFIIVKINYWPSRVKLILPMLQLLTCNNIIFLSYSKFVLSVVDDDLNAFAAD
jgi:hypothetical protein